MPDRPTPDFAAHVWQSAARLGRSAPRIVDDILRAVFPETTMAAESEGAARILRTGCISEVKRVLRTPPLDDAQAGFDQIDASFRPFVAPLQRPSYFVPERDEEVPVTELIAAPDELDAARRFMRRKGMECLAEADRLDLLYEAVVAQGSDHGTVPTFLTRAGNGQLHGEVTA
ncbi:MAG: hypothetical protein JJT81_20065 [Rubellimicrobium sp.]|nr:hypothetical protein [Rubellimicrobium sp.]